MHPVRAEQTRKGPSSVTELELPLADMYASHCYLLVYLTTYMNIPGTTVQASMSVSVYLGRASY